MAKWHYSRIDAEWIAKSRCCEADVRRGDGNWLWGVGSVIGSTSAEIGAAKSKAKAKAAALSWLRKNCPLPAVNMRTGREFKPTLRQCRKWKLPPLD